MIDYRGKLMKDIDFAIVETKRPPMYTAMKYWGKKPHNVWHEYVNNYTNKDEYVFDPFSGSAIASFEAVSCGRKAFAFDLNPLTSFIIETYASKFDKKLFTNAVNNIVETVKKDCVYQKYYCDNGNEIQHFKWNDNHIYEYGIINKNGDKELMRNVIIQNKLIDSMQAIDIPFWYPNNEFRKSESFNPSFITNIGGNTFDKIWTRRNLYILSKIFDIIKKETDENIKMQLLFGFIQTLHLSSKMCVPRSEKSNRSFSTSWGRSAYLCSKKQMEMNPLLLFESSCVNKQSVTAALQNVPKHLGKVPTINDVVKNGIDLNADINYGIVDAKKVSKYIPENKIDFIITDPPYGGLVQYLDLSYIWLSWLENIDKKYSPNYEEEITVNAANKTIGDFNNDIEKSIKEMVKVLKKDGKIVFTFHNKDLSVWNAFLSAINNAGLVIEQVVHQQNKRTGESNVSDPYGTSASDFYIRCIKKENEEKKFALVSRDEYEEKIVKYAIDIISKRGQPTPYQILFNGVLANLSKDSLVIEDFDINLQSVLLRQVNKVFLITEDTNNLWYLTDKYLNKRVKPLDEKVENSIKALLLSGEKYSTEDIIQKIFKKFPNGMTPDIYNIESILKKYAKIENGYWKVV